LTSHPGFLGTLHHSCIPHTAVSVILTVVSQAKISISILTTPSNGCALPVL
jgi:hypothetical protein